jgi:uncharacterized membrane protein
MAIIMMVITIMIINIKKPHFGKEHIIKHDKYCTRLYYSIYKKIRY